MTNNLPSPGWYPDPGNSSQVRYWDGQQWTENIQVKHGQQPDPLAAEVDDSSRSLNAKFKLNMNASRAAQEDHWKEQVRLMMKERLSYPLIGIVGLVIFVISAIASIIVLALIALCLNIFVRSGSGIGDLLFAVVIIGAIPWVVVLQLKILASLTSIFFVKMRYSFPSQWNLVSAYVITFVIVTVINLFIFIIISPSLESLPLGPLLPYLIGALIFAAVIGQALIWTRTWRHTNVVIITTVYATLAFLAMIVNITVILALTAIIGVESKMSDKQSDQTIENIQIPQVGN